ncbi:MAG: hypothetical protein V4444_10990 [Pseudomonadota bacterium]
MDRSAQKLEVDRNYDAFMRMLASILDTHEGEYALMRNRKVVEFFDSPRAANVAGTERFSDGVYSIQEVTDEPIDLGFWSNVAAY